jgi:predicted nucleotidyltransferase component of viral defense system
MEAKEFNQFRLVGGTALSLYCGHRMSVDIDIFTEAEYGTIDFDGIEDYLVKQFTYVDFNKLPVGMGKSYFVGYDSQNAIKLDLYYTEPFIDNVVEIDAIRMATIEEIIAMKIDVIQSTGRKKDYWDLHELKDQYNIKDMMAFHLKRYPYKHNEKQILNNFVDFKEANEDFDPVCLRDKYWEFIKLDLIDFVNN